MYKVSTIKKKKNIKKNVQYNIHAICNIINGGNCSGARGWGCHVQYNTGPRISRSVFMAPDDRVITALQCTKLCYFHSPVLFVKYP